MTQQFTNIKPVLTGYLERIERLIEEKNGLLEDIRDIKREAKGAGFDMKQLNNMIKLRAMDPDKRREEEELRDIYIAALDLI